MSGELHQRTLYDLGPKSCPGAVSIPTGVVLNDGLTEEEAVAIAMWNNRDLQATFATLGIARGDVIQAGLLTNPTFNLLFPPIGSKQLEWTVFLPVESILLRKVRVQVAERDYQRVANDLVQFGLNTARDTRLAYADLVLATEQLAWAEESVSIRQEIADLAAKRLEAGDIGELELLTAKSDAIQSQVDAAGAAEAVAQARDRLRLVMGIATLEAEIVVQTNSQPGDIAIDVDSLVYEATETRPDLRAAGMLVAAAQYRLELAQKAFLRIDAVADGNHDGLGPSNVGPGLRADLPVFNKNEGGIVRARWELEQASNNFYAIRDRITTEVRTSASSVRQAKASLDVLQNDLMPTLADSVAISRKAYEAGGVDYFLILQASQQYLAARSQELTLKASLARAHAELDRSVGRRISKEALREYDVPFVELTPVLESKDGLESDDVLQDDNALENDIVPALPEPLVQLDTDVQTTVPEPIRETVAVAPSRRSGFVSESRRLLSTAARFVVPADPFAETRSELRAVSFVEVELDDEESLSPDERSNEKTSAGGDADGDGRRAPSVPAPVEEGRQ